MCNTNVLKNNHLIKNNLIAKRRSMEKITIKKEKKKKGKNKDARGHDTPIMYTMPRCNHKSKKISAAISALQGSFSPLMSNLDASLTTPS